MVILEGILRTVGGLSSVPDTHGCSLERRFSSGRSSSRLKEAWHEHVVDLHRTSRISVFWPSSNPIGLCVRHVDEDIAEGVVDPYLRRARCIAYAVTD
jgi:hypothetical protein